MPPNPIPRSGLRRVVALTTPPGRSNQHNPRFRPCPWTRARLQLQPRQTHTRRAHPNSTSRWSRRHKCRRSIRACGMVLHQTKPKSFIPKSGHGSSKTPTRSVRHVLKAIMTYPVCHHLTRLRDTSSRVVQSASGTRVDRVGARKGGSAHHRAFVCDPVLVGVSHRFTRVGDPGD